MEKENKKIKLYIGGSPCTHWSIAQTKNRETEPSGLGWELFKNYVIGLKKYKPDYFLYENNKSMSPAIKEQITKELGVEPILINSALVSAQNRNRLYWTNIPEVKQPEDRGILLKDILETGMTWKEKSYTLDANYYKTAGTYNPKSQHSYSRHMAAEPIKCLTENEMNYMIREISDGRNHFDFGYIQDTTRDKGKCITANISKGVPYNVCCEFVFPFGTNDKGKAHCLDANYWKGSLPISTLEKHRRSLVAERWDGKTFPVYEVFDGKIIVNGESHPIKLSDGYYIIRKLTVKECMRLQTVPETYNFTVSNTQAYKMLGNGWTIDVISHILSFIPGITEKEINVMSMYDGMSCGHIALDKLGANVEKYYATEIDKYAIQAAKENYPEMIHLGDAYQVRNEDWTLN